MRQKGSAIGREGATMHVRIAIIAFAIVASWHLRDAPLAHGEDDNLSGIYTGSGTMTEVADGDNEGRSQTLSQNIVVADGGGGSLKITFTIDEAADPCTLKAKRKQGGTWGIAEGQTCKAAKGDSGVLINVAPGSSALFSGTRMTLLLKLGVIVKAGEKLAAKRIVYQFQGSRG